ncbi:MAG: 4-alpha-glucanotransferase [Elusimicrobiota bacterium]|jgi:4-alpha-glucanotransferase|nr:4-alpha-glucanotransferase [Elusimicrobiota bacterium]
MADLKDNPILNRRTAGVLLPLFSMRGSGDWGCGDMASFAQWIEYFAQAGVKVIQILPINECGPQENSPYSALSAYAIDPVYISMDDVPEVKASAAAQRIIEQSKEEIKYWRWEARLQFKYIKSVKLKTLWAAYEHFLKEEGAKNTKRYNDFLAFEARHAAWLVPYTLFRCMKDQSGWTTWKHWQKPFKEADINFLKTYAAKNSKQMMYFAYMQWIAQQQLEGIKKLAAQKGALIFGDIPFGVNFDSADVWSNQKKYLLDTEVGAPGDMMARGGQRWGLPAYNWAEVELNNFNLWRGKVKRACELYDAFRLDHLVGFFRTWIYAPGDDAGRYDLTDEEAQLSRGTHFMEAVIEAARGSLPIGEDLGVIPDYLRKYMRDISLPGYKVLRWEKDAEVYRDPKAYAAASLATTSTHDTEMLSQWWEGMQDWGRAAAWKMLTGYDNDGRIPFDQHSQRIILKRLLDGASAMVIVPLQDVMGISGRINIPGTISEDNWTWRVPYEPKEFQQKFAAQMEMFTQLIKESGR